MLQASPQEVPSQVALPFATVGQTVHEDPQAVRLVLSWHEPPQSW